MPEKWDRLALPAAAGLYAALLLVVYLFGINFQGEGAYLSDAVFLRNGLLPYRDFHYPHPPSFLLWLVPFVTGLGSSLYVGRLAAFAAALWLFLAVLRASRHAGGSSAMVLAALIMLCNPQQAVYAGTLLGPYAISVAPLVTAFDLVFFSRGRGRAFAAGALAVFAAGARITSIPAAFLLALAGMLNGRWERRERMGFLWGLTLTGFFIFGVPLLLSPQGFVGDAFGTYLLAKVFRAEQFEGAPESIFSLRGRLEGMTSIIRAHFPEYALVPALAGAAFVSALRSGRPLRTLLGPAGVSLGLFLIILGGHLLPYPSLDQYHCMIIPLAALASAVLAGPLLPRLEFKTAVVLGATYLLLIAPRFLPFPPHIFYLDFRHPDLFFVARVGKALDSLTPSGEPVLSDWSMFPPAAHRSAVSGAERGLSRSWMIQAEMLNQGIGGERNMGRGRLMELVERRAVPTVALTFGNGYLGDDPEIVRLIEKYYEEAAEFKGTARMQGVRLYSRRIAPHTGPPGSAVSEISTQGDTIPEE